MKIGPRARHVIAAMIAVGHPIVFLVFLFFVSTGRLGSPDNRLFGMPLFFSVETNVDRINFWVYVPYALGLYGLWIGIQYLILRQLRGFSWEDFASKKFTVPYLALCGMGYLNLCFWAIGMEGNVFGFIFFLPLLMLSLVVGILEFTVFFKRKTP